MRQRMNFEQRPEESLVDYLLNLTFLAFSPEDELR